jgi:putative tryptophan/tyrosine transport system substrate-binding protein
MTLRRELLGFALLSAAAASLGQAKSPSTVKRKLGVLIVKGRDEKVDELERELRSALAKLGWVVDRNLTIEWHFANKDRARLPALAAQIVRSGPDAILTFFSPPTTALQLATTTIPIVTSVGDPIGFGFTRSYARPDGNITGLSLGYVESQRKSIELLRVAVPATRRLILGVAAHRASDVEGLTGAAVAAARELGLVPETVLLATTADVQAVLRLDHTSVMMLYGFDGPSSTLQEGEVIALALARRIPTVGGNSESVALGALLAYTLYWDNNIQRIAAQLDKILRGVSPAQIPFELPSRSWLALNRKTARVLGIVLPSSLLARADEVID